MAASSIGEPGADGATVVEPATTALGSLSQSDLARSRSVAGLGALLATAATFAMLLIDGDATARAVMMAGLGLVGVINLGVYAILRDPGSMRTGFVVVWTTSALGTLAMLPFCGVLSAAVIAPFLVVVLGSLGQSRAAAISALVTVTVGHATLVVLVATGAIADRARMPAPSLTPIEVVVAELFFLGVVVVGFAIGRWARHNTMRAFDELERRARAEGQREVLDEARELARALGAGRLGRYSDQRLGRFQVGEIIGRGAMGEVYEAIPDDGGAAVALKVLHEDAELDPERLARFEREAVAIAAIDSRHVVGLIEVGASPVRYLVMERLHGADLAAVLRERRTLDADALLRLTADVARGLEAARRAGVVHRDIKPPNLFEDRATGRWKILDFGVSRLTGGDSTLTGDRVIGTPAYMAPEQVTGDPIVHATDVYGLAAVVYRCLTGRAPHGGDHINEVLYRVAHTRPRRPSAIAPVSPAVDAVLAIGLARRAGDRYASAQAFATALRAAVLGHEVAEDTAEWA